MKARKKENKQKDHADVKLAITGLTYWGISKTFSLVCNNRWGSFIDSIHLYKFNCIFQVSNVTRILRKVHGVELTPWRTRFYRHFLQIWHLSLFAASVDQNDRRKNSPLPSTIIKTWPSCGPCYLWNETVDLLNNSDRSRNKREQDFTQFKLNVLFQENSSCADLPGTTYWKALQNIFKKNYGNLRG